MSATLYLDAASGISGDMTVAALLDLGVDADALCRTLATLPADGFEMCVSRVMKSGLSACDFDVVLDAAHENHDHDMAWLHGADAEPAGRREPGENAHSDGGAHEHVDAHACDQAVPHVHEHGGSHACDREASHEHEHEHAHAHGEHDGHDEHSHEHAHAHSHSHAHRSLADVYAIIDASELTPHAKDIAHRIFAVLGRAEAKAHGTTPDAVMLHEVGAVDSIVDICAVAFCIDALGIDEMIVPYLAEGRGTIRCAHGIMPVPVPAVANIVADAGIELAPAPVSGELVTPTGAAIVAALRTADALPARYRIRAIGLGAGKRTYANCSGILRALLIEDVSERATAQNANASAIGPDEACAGGNAPAVKRGVAGAGGAADAADADDSGTFIVKLECDLDDCTGEALGRVIDELMGAGAREAHALPLVMKKGRPGHQLQVICDEAGAPALESIIFRTTTTIGIRRALMQRTVLPRRAASVQTGFGEIAVKEVVLPDGQVRAYPEYASVIAACERTGASYQDVSRAAIAACERRA